LGTAKDEQLWRRGQAPRAAYLNVKNRERQMKPSNNEEVIMKLAHNWRMRAGLFLLVLGCISLPGGILQSAMAAQSCSLETLKGTYTFEYEGPRQGGHQGVGVFVPFAFAGFEFYNGDGTMRGVFTGSNDGSIVKDVEFTGIYTVNPDCTSELTTTDPVFGVTHYEQFLAPSGDEFTWVQTDEGFVASGSERRVSHEVLK
jgi:hypothetical protein